MATSNFRTQAGFPLFATTLFDGNSYDIDDNFIIYKHAKSRIELFNDTLDYYYIELENGYYNGTQTVLMEKVNGFGESCLIKDYTPAEWKQERAKSKKVYGCYCGQALPYSQQQKAERKELKRIIEFCRTVLKTEYDFNEYNCVGRFSNGEAVYEIA